MGATEGDIAKRAPFQELSAEERERLAGIAAATPRETKANGKPEAAGAWADRLKQKNPGLTAAQAAAIVGATEGDIAQRAPFQELSAEERERLAGIAAATPRETKANGKPEAAGAWADRLKQKNPGLTAAQAAAIVGDQENNIAQRAPFQELSAEERERLAGIAAATPRETKANGKPEAAGAWADRLKQKNPGLTAAQAAAIVGDQESNIAKRAPFQELSAEERERLAGIAAATPRETKANGKPEAAGAWADRLKQKNPGLTAAQAAAIVGAREGDIAQRAPFQELSAEERERLAGIAAATPRETKANGKPEAAGAWADRLKQKNPGLTAAQAAAIVGATEGEIAQRAPFQELSAEERERLAGIAAATPRETKANGKPEAAGAWADRLKQKNPGLTAAQAAAIVGATEGDIAQRAPFQELSGQND